MARTLVTGATGTLGSALVPRLAEAGHSVRAASRSPPAADDGDRGATGPAEWVELDLGSAEGIEHAVEDVDVLVHAASDPTGDPEAVDARGTERLVAAAEGAGVEHLIYPSIVGVDAIPYSYYEHKLAAERAIEGCDVPWTILRATQFHQFVDELIGTVARSPVWPLPTDFRVQPIDAREVADALVDVATERPRGRADPIGGPEVRTGRELVDAYREVRGLRRLVVRLPLPGAAAREFRAGTNTCPDRAVGTTTWEDWLAEEYGGALESPSATAGGSQRRTNG
ncbi:MAG: SDR family oxidoreductase [Halosimplex sp.]